MSEPVSGRPRVVVAMSGGVDSSVAAALLVQQGYDVVGMMLRLWSEPGYEDENRCCTPDAMAMARRVAARLGIPFYAIDAQQIFHDIVITEFIESYARGETPNPCLVCNRQIRWGFLRKRAHSIGAKQLATGHYAMLRPDSLGNFHLFKATDINKDQSYVLHTLDQEQLSQAIFPLGGYTKAEVRQLARDFSLPVAERAESQDLCFLGNQDYRAFLSRQAPHIKQLGPILNRQGQLLGEHQGLASYTIGQRKGLGIPSLVPLYVLDKDVKNNALIIGIEDDLGKNQLVAAEMNWISGIPPGISFQAQVKVRYKARAVQATIVPVSNDRVNILFEQKIRDITPGQAAVIYDGEECLGGGIIQI